MQKLQIHADFNECNVDLVVLNAGVTRTRVVSLAVTPKCGQVQDSLGKLTL